MGKPVFIDPSISSDMKRTFTLLFLLSAIGCIFAQTGLNEKSAVPKGFGDKNLIEPNTDITYIIRFQNIGSDTAFNLKILDTLSLHLNPASVRPQESSHEYELEVEDGRTVALFFSGIKLPGNEVDKEGSCGYVSFTVSQNPDLPTDTKIYNSAAIFFDFNAPIITNEYFHTIGENFLPSSTVKILRPGLEVDVYPNPVSTLATFELGNASFAKGQILVFDGMGKMAATQFFNQSRFQFDRGELPSGNYFFKINLDSQHVASGQFLLK